MLLNDCMSISFNIVVVSSNFVKSKEFWLQDMTYNRIMIKLSNWRVYACCYAHFLDCSYSNIFCEKWYSYLMPKKQQWIQVCKQKQQDMFVTKFDSYVKFHMGQIPVLQLNSVINGMMIGAPSKTMVRLYFPVKCAVNVSSFWCYESKIKMK